MYGYIQDTQDELINNHLRMHWYEIWDPSLIAFLDKFYDFSESEINNRIEFQQKPFERVLLPSFIGFSFVIIKTRSIPFSVDIDIATIISTLNLLIFIERLLLSLSFLIIRFPALKLELTKWIEEHVLNLYTIDSHPQQLPDEKELNKDFNPITEDDTPVETKQQSKS